MISTYKYNQDGIRDSKTIGTVTTTYYLNGSLVLYETDRTNEIYYTYDVDGSLISMRYNGSEYFYMFDALGNVSYLIDSAGYTVVYYRYDAYANITAQTSSTLANANPYRYRGYRYNLEINMYYLNSRYYNPVLKRFISSDKIIGQLSHIGSTNMYAYVNNNPINFADEEGEFWHLVGGFVVGAAIGAVTQIAANVVSGNEWSDGVITAIAVGGLTGLLTSAGVGSLAIGISAGLTAASGNQIEDCLFNGEQFNIYEFTVDAVIVGVLAGVGSSYGSKKIGYTSKQIKHWFKPGSFKTMISGNYIKKITEAVAYSAIPALEYALFTSLKGDQYENSKINIE